MTSAITHMPLFALPWERSEDFGWGFPYRKGGSNGRNGIRAYDNAASVKPITDIGRGAYPLKIIPAAVSSVFISVMNHGERHWIRHKGSRDKPMDQGGLRVSIFGKLYLWVSSCIAPKLSQPQPDVAIPPLPIINDAGHTQDAPKVADAVKPFVSSYISPDFSIQTRHLYSRWEKPKNGFLDIKNVTLSGIRPGQVGNLIPVVDGYTQVSGSKHSSQPTPTVIRCSAKAANAPEARNLVSALVSGNWQPLLIHVSLLKNLGVYMASIQSRQDERLASNYKELP